MRNVRRLTIAAIAGSAALAATLSACTSPSVPARPQVNSYSVQQSVEAFAGIDYDYDPAPSPAALAEQSRLVVTGTIDRVQEGRVQTIPTNDQAPEISTIVLVLGHAKPVLGSLEQDSDGFVYLELPNPGGREAKEYQDGLRAGAEVVAYLVPASDGAPAENIDSAIADSKAGRPPGQALYLPAGPQALILKYQDEALVWPLIGQQLDGRLEDTLPGGKLIAS